MTALFVITGWCRAFLGWLVTPSEKSFIDSEKRRIARAKKYAQEALRGR